MAGLTLFTQSAYDAEHEEYLFGLDCTPPAHKPPPAIRLMHWLARMAHRLAEKLPGHHTEEQQLSKAERELERALRDIM